MLRFVMTRGHEYTLEEMQADPGFVRFEVWDYDRLLASPSLPVGTWVFTDLDRLSDPDLELAAAVARDLRLGGARVLNDPARFRGRWALLRRLRLDGRNAFDAYRVDEGRVPERFPVFLRRERGHGEAVGGLLGSMQEVEAALEEAARRGIPRAGLVLIEYCGEPVAPGLFRKIGQFQIGGRAVPHLCVHEDRWMVKYGKKGSATPELYRDELEIARTLRYREPVRAAFEAAGLDFGRADFGIFQGRVQIWEINSNPHFKRGAADHPNPARVETQSLVWASLKVAFRELDRESPAGTGGGIPISDSRMKRFQGPEEAGAKARFVV